MASIAPSRCNTHEPHEETRKRLLIGEARTAIKLYSLLYQLPARLGQPMCVSADTAQIALGLLFFKLNSSKNAPLGALMLGI